MALTKFNFKHFLAGCATDVKETQLGESDLNFLMVANGINQSYSLGKIKKDLGYVAVGGQTQDNKNILGLFHFRQSSAIDKILATCNDATDDDTQLFYSTGGNWTEVTDAETAWANEANVQIEMESFIGYCFFVGYNAVDGFLPVATLTGTTFSTSAQCTSMPQAKYIKRYKDRIYIANCYNSAAYPYRVYFSSIPSSGNITWTPALNFFDVDFSEEITGITENFGYLIIFNQYSTYFYNGTSLKKIFETGCSNNRSIQNIGKYCVWADQDNVWASYQGSEPEAIGQPIVQLIQNSTSSNWQSAVIDKEYCLYLGTTDANGISYTNCLAIYNIQTKLWRWRTLGDSIKSMTKYFTSGQDYLLLGNDDGDIFKKSKYIDSTIYYSDAGASIKAELRTKALDFGDSDIEKTLKKVTVKSKYGQGMVVRARAWDKNNEADMPFTDIGTITDGHNSFFGAIVENIKGRFIQFEFVEYSTKQAFEFLEFAVYVDGLTFEE